MYLFIFWPLRLTSTTRYLKRWDVILSGATYIYFLISSCLSVFPRLSSRLFVHTAWGPQGKVPSILLQQLRTRSPERQVHERTGGDESVPPKTSRVPDCSVHLRSQWDGVLHPHHRLQRRSSGLVRCPCLCTFMVLWLWCVMPFPEIIMWSCMCGCAAESTELMLSPSFSSSLLFFNC